MKININLLKITPNSTSKNLEVGLYGPSDLVIDAWAKHHQLKISTLNGYTNIEIHDQINLSDLFIKSIPYEWLDGFSPNLNKKLHIGHLSNLVLAKAFKNLGVCKNTVSIYGDTLKEGLDKSTALSLLRSYQDSFDYHPEKEFMASEVKCNDKLLIDGEGDYKNTKVFNIDGTKIVGIKSDQSTSYFYQDVALAETLGGFNLYLTGKEQENHFSLLQKLFPHIKHIGLGLVKISGKKMSSRTNNVVLIEELINYLNKDFSNLQLIYNIFAGFILKSAPTADKNVNLELVNNPKNSPGLYISYTTARLISANCLINNTTNFHSKTLEFAELKSNTNLKPNILFDALIQHCKEINSLYGTHVIKDNADNKKMFEELLSDLILGCKKLGLFVIHKV